MTALFRQEFWQTLGEKMLTLLIKEGPTFLLIIVLAFLAFKGLSLFIQYLKHLMLRSTRKKDEIRFREMEKRMETLLGMVKGLGDVAIWAIVLMISLKKVGIDIGPLIAGAGIIGVALGFGSQELVRDMISGFFILLENQIRTGDVAIINGTSGLVERIGLRTILLRDLTGTVHIFQNGKINTLSNMTKDWSAIVLDVHVAYKENTDQVMGVIRQVGGELLQNVEYQQRLLEDIEIFGVDQFADSSVVIKVRIKTKPGEQWAVGREFRRLLKKAFDANNIEIPFPHTTLYWGDKTKQQAN